MTHGSLFSGIGGFDLAADWMGWNNVFHCEWSEFGQRILKYYWPNAISYGDIAKTDFTIHRGRIDILTGGDPCQPSSVAGKQLGFEDERYLWPEMFRAIREIKPAWVVNENVPGTITNGILDEKIWNLENEGYETWPPLLIPSGAVGTPHNRKRIWLVAYSKRNKQYGEKSCSGKIGRMGRQFQPIPWERDWKDALSEFRSMDDGIPNILAQTDGYRNAIVPQVAYQIFKTIEKYESL